MANIEPYQMMNVSKFLSSFQDVRDLLKDTQKALNFLDNGMPESAERVLQYLTWVQTLPGYKELKLLGSYEKDLDEVEYQMERISDRLKATRTRIPEPATA